MTTDISGGLYRLTMFNYINIGNVLYAAGRAGAALANGDTSHAWSIPSISDYTPERDSLVKTDRMSGDKKKPGLMFGSAYLKGFKAKLSDVQTAIIAAAHGTSVDETTSSVWDIWTEDTNAVAVANLGMILTALAEDQDTGATVFDNLILPMTKAVFSIAKGKPQAMDEVDVDVIVKASKRTPWGSLVSALGISAPDGEVSGMHIRTSHPLALTVFRSDASDTTFITQYRPASTVVTDNATPNYFTRNGVDQALSSIVTTTGVATMAAAGTAGDMNILLYEADDNFVLI